MSFPEIEIPDTMVVSRAQMKALIKEVSAIREQKATLTLREKVMLLAKGGTLRTPDVCKLTGWSNMTFRRRVKDFAIPMIKDGRDYHIDAERFIEWYTENFK